MWIRKGKKMEITKYSINFPLVSEYKKNEIHHKAFLVLKHIIYFLYNL